MWNHNTKCEKGLTWGTWETFCGADAEKELADAASDLTTWKHVFFFWGGGPSMTKLVFRFCEMPIFTFESCACHLKMNMNFALHFTKSHEYHVFAFSRKNNENETDNPSQGAESTAYYLVFGFSVARSRIFVPAVYLYPSHPAILTCSHCLVNPCDLSYSSLFDLLNPCPLSRTKFGRGWERPESWHFCGFVLHQICHMFVGSKVQVKKFSN